MHLFFFNFYEQDFFEIAEKKCSLNSEKSWPHCAVADYVVLLGTIQVLRQQRGGWVGSENGKQAALGHESGFRFPHTRTMKYSSCKMEQQGSRA